jgi:hypothetical protein
MQTNLDFSKPHLQEGKKDFRIPVAVSPELKEFVEMMSRVQDTSVSELGHRYFVEGLQRDVASRFMREPHLDKTLRELLARF